MLEYQLKNSEGKLVCEGSFVLTNAVSVFPIELNGFSKGVYLLHYKINEYTKVEKVVIP